MIITGLNNKDLLGCTYNQIMNIIKSSTPPITLRLKQINIPKEESDNNLLPPINALSLSYKSHSSSSIIAANTPLYGPYSSTTPDCDNINTPKYSIDQFDDMSDSDEEYYNNKYQSTNLCNDVIKESEEEDIDDDDGNNNGMSSVDWNNIRLGKYK